VIKSFLATAALVLFSASAILAAQAPADGSRKIEGGGITVPGWTGKIDANEERAGQVLQDAKFAQQAGVFQIVTGPAVSYWNPANAASGNYTVNATFT
jgi:hypothetical protein